MIAARVIFGALTWVLHFLITMPLVVSGLVIVPVAYLTGQWQPSYITGKPIYNAPRWLWLWGNDEDGYLPEWYAAAHPSWGRFRRAFMWAAIRNTVNNLRFVLWLNPPQRVDLVRWETWGHFTFVWQGWRSRLLYSSDSLWVGIGWKYEPKAVSATGWQAYGQGFGIRLKWLKQ